MRTLRTQRRQGAASAGFSLVELLAVVIVLGMMATLVSVNWKAILPRTNLNSTVRSIAATISGTRSDAIARNAEFGILYDISRNKWRVVSPFLLGGGLAPNFEDRHKFEWIECKQTVEIESITVEGTEYTENPTEEGLYVRFDPLGGSSGHTIVLYQPDFDNHFTIEVLALTGVVRMHSGLYQRDFVDDTNFSN